MSSDEWTREDSEEVAERVLPIVQAVASLDRDDLGRALQELERYDAAGPFVDPTGYRENMDANQNAKERLRALIAFYDALDYPDGFEAKFHVDGYPDPGGTHSTWLEAAEEVVEKSDYSILVETVSVQPVEESEADL